MYHNFVKSSKKGAHKRSCRGAGLKLDSAYIDTSMYDEPEDRGVIEVPADAETVVYIDDEGQAYEISIDELIDADTDNEIEYVPDDDDKEEADDELDLKSNKITKKRRVGYRRTGRMAYQSYLSLAKNSFAKSHCGRVR